METPAFTDLLVAVLVAGITAAVAIKVGLARLEERIIAMHREFGQRLDATEREITNQVSHARERYDIMTGRMDGFEARLK